MSKSDNKIVSLFLEIQVVTIITCPDSKVHGANMGPTWVLSAPDGPHVGPMNLAIRVVTYNKLLNTAVQWWQNMEQAMNLQKTTHSSPSQVSYGVSAASVLQKTYCVLTL